MVYQKVKFVTGFGSFGGSSVAILEHCRLLSENGFDVSFYAPGSWHIGRFEGAKDIGELKIEPEDIVIFHHVDLQVRPKCKRSVLYLHEKSLWPLGGRNLLPFDSIAYVSTDQMLFHGVRGRVVPNPVGRMVDLSKNNPPRSNIAGIVGTIQTRKRQHVSIRKALEDGRDKVLLFGDFEKDYFSSEIEPLLSDKVIYMGMFDPENRMDMYNKFDFLYIFSSDESASLALGECRLLGKEVFKSDEVSDYEIPDDEEILSSWKDVFFDGGPLIQDRCVYGSSEKCEGLVCVVTHKRKELVGRWLRAWNNANKFGCKIAVLHACDSDVPDEDEMDNILSYNPDFYLPFRNSPLRDMMALHLVLRDAAGLPDWDRLFWFTDDMIPMRRDFLEPFVSKLSGNVGMVAQCYEPRHDKYSEAPGLGCLPHIRTVAYGLSRGSADCLRFPCVGNESDRPYMFEHGRVGLYEDHILKQVTDAGYDFALCHSDFENYVHWTSTLDWMWDCHFFSEGAEIRGVRLSAQDMWDLYESQFPKKEPADPLVIFTPELCENVVLKKNKVSAIIPTFSSPINCFMRSVFSVILRSNPSILDHLFISINGPDSREGGNELQDKKQSFLENLRSVHWSGMPGFNPGSMTITRTWSRIGHSQALDQCIPWVDTEFYLSMHDDVLVMNPGWCDLSEFLEDENVVMKTWGGYLAGKLRTTGTRLDMPHLNTIFTLCRKSLMTSLGVGWVGFCFDKKFRVHDYTDPKALESKHSAFSSLGLGSEIRDIQYESVSLDIGSFIFSKIKSKGLEIRHFDSDVLRHFESASWNPHGPFRTKEVEDLEKEILSVPEYGKIYTRYLEDE